MHNTVRFILSFTLLIFLDACNHSKNDHAELQRQVDSLNNRLENIYVPGLGEFMTSIQLHHAKLWFAGTNGNWDLANFEMEEIQETLDDIQKYNRDRPEIKDLPIILGPLDSVKTAIAAKNLVAFKKSFNFLTTGCNNCHQITKHEFNIITIPDSPPVTNQAFEKH